MVERLEKTAFAENVQTRFRVMLESPGPVELELTHIREIPSTPQQEQFALVFSGPTETFLPQGTYQMEHERMGSFVIFIVPLGRNEQGFQYEAVFNRMLT